MQEEEAQKKPNPVVQRVKIIMALGLTVVHLHGWFLSGITGLSFGLAPHTSGDELSSPSSAPSDEIVRVPLQDYLLWKAFNLSGDQVCGCFSPSPHTLCLCVCVILQIVTLALSTVLFVKYIFLDKATTFPTSVPPTPSSGAPPLDSAPVSACPIKVIDGGAPVIRRRRTTNSGSSTTYAEECPHLSEPLPPPSTGAVNGVLPTESLAPPTDRREGKSFLSVAVQTMPPSDGGVFVLRKDSLSSSESSGLGGSGDEVTVEEEGRGGDTPPRTVTDCLSIFQSDVSPLSLSSSASW